SYNYYFNIGFDKSKAINYTAGIARSHANIGYALDRLDRKNEAVKHYEQSLKLFKKLNIKRSINQSITNLGAIYYDLNEFKLADVYFKKVLENVLETPNDQIGLGNALYSLGNSNLELGNFKKSKTYYTQSLNIRAKIGDLNGLALSNLGLGRLANRLKDFNKAVGYFNIALKHNAPLKNVYQEAVILNALATAQLGLKDYKKAEKNAKLALTKANESGTKSLSAESLELLVEISLAQKKFEEANVLQTNYTAVNDSLNLKQVKKEVMINDLHRMNSDNNSLEHTNKSITAQNKEYLIVILVITALLIAIGVLFALYYKRNAEKKAANNLLQSQKKEIAEFNEELGALNDQLVKQMDLVSAQNIELEKLNKVKNKFFSIVSHDLRSPLNNLKMLFSVYRSGGLDEEELKMLLEKLEETTINTASFLDNLLEWSKNQLDGLVVNPNDFNIHSIVNSNIDLLEAQIKLKALNVYNNVPEQLTAFADANMMNVVFRNLLSNAVKFCTMGDKIIFEAKLVDGKIYCSVNDSGRGISSEEMENLFTLTQNLSSGTAGEKGYHVGLILCKDMVQQNNGSISVISELGKGSSFEIILPAQQQKANLKPVEDLEEFFA
ncbi:MAG: tetratricopeptide repeat protein, partial [Flavobacterium sp.]